MARSTVFRWLSGSLAAVAGLTAVALLATSSDRAGGVPRYNLILLTVESFRADAVSPDLTPRLLALLDESNGVYFRNHRSVSAWTVPNVVALLSGVHPIRQGILSRGHGLAVQPENGLTGRDGINLAMSSFQPFALIDSYSGLGLVREPGGEMPLALAAMARASSRQGLWYHYLDTHLPHRPTLPDGTQPEPDTPGFDTAFGLPPPRDDLERARRLAVATQPVVPVDQFRFPAGDRQWVQAFYQSEIRAFDRWFEGFFDMFRRTGLARNTVLVVTADHGEELAEAGRVGHASTTREGVLSDAVLNVPMMIWTPDAGHRAALQTWSESGVVTDHVDLGGSLAALLGAPMTAYGVAPEVPVGLQPRDLTDSVVPAARYAFTSAAGFAEPDPERSAYLLLSREDLAGRQVVRLDWRAVMDRDVSLDDEFGSVAATLALPSAAGTSEGNAVLNGPIRWIWPRQSGDVTYPEIRDRSRIEWSGPADARYVLEYAAGTGALRMAGEIDVQGNGYAFGKIDEDYWRTFVVPYGQVRFRVRDPAGGAVSEWLTVRMK